MIAGHAAPDNMVIFLLFQNTTARKHGTTRTFKHPNNVTRFDQDPSLLSTIAVNPRLFDSSLGICIRYRRQAEISLGMKYSSRQGGNTRRGPPCLSRPPEICVRHIMTWTRNIKMNKYLEIHKFYR